MNLFEKIAREATAGMPAPTQGENLDALAKELGVSRGDLPRLIAIAGWDPKRLTKEREVIGIAIRFAESVNAGLEREAYREATSAMAHILKGGPMALAGSDAETLSKMVSSSELRAAMLQYEPMTHGGRLVMGPTGIGKSAAAVGILRRMLNIRAETYLDRQYVSGGESPGYRPGRRKSHVYCRAFDLPNARLAQKLGNGEADLVERAVSADFLVLDDIGWESRRAGADDVVLEVLASRYDLGRPTYVSTGLQRKQFEERYGSAVERRITEAGGLPGRVLNLWGSE